MNIIVIFSKTSFYSVNYSITFSGLMENVILTKMYLSLVPKCVVGKIGENTIKEPIFVRVNDTSFNRNLGKYQLSNIWEEVLQDTPALHLQ